MVNITITITIVVSKAIFILLSVFCLEVDPLYSLNSQVDLFTYHHPLWFFNYYISRTEK